MILPFENCFGTDAQHSFAATPLSGGSRYPTPRATAAGDFIPRAPGQLQLPAIVLSNDARNRMNFREGRFVLNFLSGLTVLARRQQRARQPWCAGSCLGQPLAP